MAGIIIGGIVLLLALLVGLIGVFGTRAKAKVTAKYPAPGQMVDVGGHRLHIHCQGDHALGSPTVVMESGNGEPSLTWAAIQPEVARFARVCTYDRAGLGWSERSPKPRTVGNVVDELHTLLARAGLEPPYVLVGHSMGGGLVRLYAREHPDQVAGMVLVDPLLEEQEQRWPEAVRRLSERSRKAMVPSFRLGQMSGDEPSQSPWLGEASSGPAVELTCRPTLRNYFSYTTAHNNETELESSARWGSRLRGESCSAGHLVGPCCKIGKFNLIGGLTQNPFEFTILKHSAGSLIDTQSGGRPSLNHCLNHVRQGVPLGEVNADYETAD
jgi:pimeloyl-ACP methyl ester carboxylesterase